MSATRQRLLFSTILLLGLFHFHRAQGAALVWESFDSDPDWYARDGELTVSWSSGVGNAPGSLHGYYDAQDVPSPEIDAFRVDYSVAGGPWVGDYHTLYPTFTAFTFDFMAQNVLPSSFVIQIGDGATTFIRNLLPQVMSIGSFGLITVPLVYDAGWLGGSASQFYDVLGSVAFIDLQLGRNTTAAQNYYVDNFSLNDDELSPPPPSSAGVPEPAAVHMVIIAMTILFATRRQSRLARRGIRP